MNKLRELVSSAYESCERDCDLAVKDVIAQVMADMSLYREVTAPLLEYAVRNEVETIMRGTRSRYWAPTVPREDTISGLRQRAIENLMDYPLSRGKRLADATKLEIAEDGQHLIGTGKTAILRGHWLLLVADNLKAPESVCAKELREADLKRLQKKAKKDFGDLNIVGPQSSSVAASNRPANSAGTPSNPVPATRIAPPIAEVPALANQ